MKGETFTSNNFQWVGAISILYILSFEYALQVLAISLPEITQTMQSPNWDCPSQVETPSFPLQKDLKLVC